VVTHHLEKVMHESLEIRPHMVLPSVADRNNLLHVPAHQRVDGSFVLIKPFHLHKTSVSDCGAPNAGMHVYLIRDGPTSRQPQAMCALCALVAWCRVEGK
jgi:hypothetical protein